MSPSGSHSFPGSPSYPKNPDFPSSDSGLVAEVKAKMANTFYGERLGPNKRPHTEEESTQSTHGIIQQPSQQPSQQQPSQQHPTGFPQMTGNQPLQFQAVGDRPKKKGQRKIGKRIEPQPLVGMLDETTEAYDKPLSIRHVLKNNKVDMTWMDYLAWSPAACKELKRLCTRMSKKRVPKAKAVAVSTVPTGSTYPTNSAYHHGLHPVLP